jgi:hypothetical protein
MLAPEREAGREQKIMGLPQQLVLRHKPVPHFLADESAECAGGPGHLFAVFRPTGRIHCNIDLLVGGSALFDSFLHVRRVIDVTEHFG